MKTMVKRVIALIAATMCLSVTFGCDFMQKEKKEPIHFKDVENVKNVILMIGDGMGPNQVRAGELYKKSKLTMQSFPYHVNVETRSHSDYITDSSAAATALATGVRINNSQVGIDLDGNHLETIVDIAASKGKRTGIMTTEWLAGATPMGFSSHDISRNNSIDLIQEAAKTSNVNLFLSDTCNFAYHFEKEGWTEIDDPALISDATEDKIFGSYKILAEVESMSLHPDFTAFDGLIVEALEYLSKDEDGFFLMAEGAHIDHGGHNNDFDYMLRELMAFDAAVEVVAKWAMNRNDTVVIVTADHETGGLILDKGVTSENLMESYRWTTGGHSGVDVDCFIAGVNVDFAQYSFSSKDRIANTDVFQIMKSLVAGTK